MTVTTVPVTQAKDNSSFVSGHRFSDATRLSKSGAPLGAAIAALTFPAASATMKVKP
jgi:hypothetical protein